MWYEAGESWGEAEIARAAKLWDDGFSASGIAEVLRDDFGSIRSRSAVCGMMNRNRDLFPMRDAGGRVRRVVSISEPRPPRKAPARISRGERPAPTPISRPPRPTIADAYVYDGASLHLPLAELAAGQCKFPVNDAAPGETHLFCGKRIVRGCYCGHHADRAFGAASGPASDWAPRLLARPAGAPASLPERREGASGTAREAKPMAAA